MDETGRPRSRRSAVGPATTLDLRSARLADTDAQTLVAQVQQEYASLYGGPDETPLEPSMFEPPDGAFFVGYLGGVAVATGGWRFRPDVVALGGRTAAEIKRMYVAPHGRRGGVGRAVLAHLERTAMQAGADLMVLETGTKQPEALALYRAAGYEPVTGFGHYRDEPESRYLGRPLG